MMIAIILENYIQTLARDQSTLQLEHADAFLFAWSLYDPEATGKIEVSNLKPLIRVLPPPLGLDPKGYRNGYVGEADISRYAFQMQLQSYRDEAFVMPVVYFKEVLASLVKDTYRDTNRDARSR
jgi:hypothetical protein